MTAKQMLVLVVVLLVVASFVTTAPFFIPLAILVTAVAHLVP